MNFVRNFLKKIVSRFKESWDDRASELNQEIKRLRPLPRPLSMNFFYPNLCDHNTEQHLKKGGCSNREEYVLLVKYGINLKEIEASRLINSKIIQRKHNVLDRQICDHLDDRFVAESWKLKFYREKIFRIEIGKPENRPILYIN